MVQDFFRKIGIDTSITYTILGRLIQAGGGILVIALVGLFLNSTEQGYYYTFSSILALQQFFELGMTGLITQYAAHEKAFLEWGENNDVLNGNEVNKSRLSSLLRLTVKWFLVASLLLFIVLCIVGYIFFSKYQTSIVSVHWIFPWFLAAFSTSGMLVLIAILAFYEGLGKVKEVALIRMILQFCQITITLSVFFMGGKLYASGAAMLGSVLVGVVWIWCSQIKTELVTIRGLLSREIIDWKKEIFPYQWKIALSWMSGYFIFQLFNPVIFASEGAILAGQFGITMALINGLLSVPMSWINTKVSAFSSLIAQRKYNVLDEYFFKTLRQSLIVYGVGVLLLVIINPIIRDKYPELGSRFLPIIPFFLLLFTSLFQLLNNGLATYLRCHKQEPYLYLSLFVGICVTCSTILLGDRFGVLGIVTGYCVFSFVGLVWGFKIFIEKRKLWH